MEQVETPQPEESSKKWKPPSTPEERKMETDDRHGLLYGGGQPAKRGQPWRGGDRRERAGEPDLTITRVFSRTPAQSRISALDRLQPRARSS